METTNIGQLLATGGIASVALLILARVVMKVAERMIAAIDRVGVKIEEHTKVDLAAQGEVVERLARIEGTIGIVEDDDGVRRTPGLGVRVVRERRER